MSDNKATPCLVSQPLQLCSLWTFNGYISPKYVNNVRLCNRYFMISVRYSVEASS